MGTVLHEGHAIVTFADRAPLGGRLRYTHLGGELYEWVIEVPPAHRHQGYTASFDPTKVTSVTPCSEAEALAFASMPPATRQNIADRSPPSAA